MKTGDSARNREFESHTLRQKNRNTTLWVVFLFFSGDKGGDTKISDASLMLFLVWDVFHYVFNFTVENLTEHLYGVGADAFVSL